MARLLIGNIKGPKGAQGPTGPQGPQGVQGNPGQGVPTGGSAGQYLIKQSATNYDADWGAITTDSAPTSGGTNPITSGGVYTESGKLAAGMAILANGNTHAAITSGQFVYVRGHGTLTDGMYKATANIAANGALNTSNLTAEPSGGLNALNAYIATLNSKITTTSTTATLASGWSVAYGQNNIYKSGNFAFLLLWANGETITQSAWNLIATIPSGYLPLKNIDFLGINSENDKAVHCQITNDGRLFVYGSKDAGNSMRFSVTYPCG